MSKFLINKFVSGIQPSGTLHLGNYLGAVKQWQKVINSDNNLENIKKKNAMFFIADYHSLTSKLNQLIKNTEQTNLDNFNYSNNNTCLKDLSIQTLACLIASGINPEKCVIFLQSSVKEHTELQWILSCITPNSWLNSMIQYKEKKIDSNGLYSYPILMASDVLLYKATHVPVGEDQIQHIELISKLTERINKISYKQIFPVPKPIISEHKRVMSLTDGKVKMSKTKIISNNKSNNIKDTKTVIGKNSCVYLTDTSEDIKSKIIKAKTDSIGSIVYDKDNRPEISNLINIYSCLSGLTINNVENKFKNASTYDFKIELADLLNKELKSISEISRELISNKHSYLIDVLNEGFKEASNQANETLNELKEALKILKI